MQLVAFGHAVGGTHCPSEQLTWNSEESITLLRVTFASLLIVVLAGMTFLYVLNKFKNEKALLYSPGF